jgi:hypothetical protein
MPRQQIWGKHQPAEGERVCGATGKNIECTVAKSPIYATWLLPQSKFEARHIGGKRGKGCDQQEPVYGRMPLQQI